MHIKYTSEDGTLTVSYEPTSGAFTDGLKEPIIEISRAKEGTLMGKDNLKLTGFEEIQLVRQAIDSAIPAMQQLAMDNQRVMQQGHGEKGWKRAGDVLQ